MVDDGALSKRANVIGLGLIGGSISSGLTRAGWSVWGTDADPTTIESAIELGAIIGAGIEPDVDVSFVAVPVASVAEQALRALATTNGAVTDVGSTKSMIATTVSDPRFVGGHPMAGSEFEGFNAADPDLFRGAVWLLTPSPSTDEDALASVSVAIRDLEADIIALEPSQHDRVVATVSHVPHLAAATLMQLASKRSVEHQALLRIAAGGFRDMTRIASGAPGIWLDICDQNRDAIDVALGELIADLTQVREMVRVGDRDRLEAALSDARTARRNLPSRVVQPENVAEVRVPILDRASAAAEIFSVAAALEVNIANFGVSHSAEGHRGIAFFDVDADAADRFRDALAERGYHPVVERLQ